MPDPSPSIVPLPCILDCPTNTQIRTGRSFTSFAQANEVTAFASVMNTQERMRSCLVFIVSRFPVSQLQVNSAAVDAALSVLVIRDIALCRTENTVKRNLRRHESEGVS